MRDWEFERREFERDQMSMGEVEGARMSLREEDE